MEYSNLDVINLSWLPREIASRHSVPHLGHATATRIHSQGFTLDDGRLKRGAAAITLRNCAGAFATSGRRKRFSGGRYWRSMRRALTAIPAKRRRNFSLLRCSAEQDALGAHGDTAAEIVHDRADAAEQNMGLITGKESSRWVVF